MFEIRGKQKEGMRVTAVVERERETADNGGPVSGAKGKGWLSGEGRQKKQGHQKIGNTRKNYSCF